MNDKIGIILQARTGSSRLPGKVFKKIGKWTILEYIFFRLSFLRHKIKVVLATSDISRDDILEEFCRTSDIPCFRGSEQNVLSRYYFCALSHQFAHIVRLTGDNPFTDIEELDNLIAFHFEKMPDFAQSLEVLPVGVGAEIFTFSALEKSYHAGKAARHIEHADEYILENPSLFKSLVLPVSAEKRRHDIRLTVDIQEDYERACYIIEHAKDEFVTTPEAISLAEEFSRIKAAS